MEKKRINLIVSILFAVALFLFMYFYRKNKTDDIVAHPKFTIGKIFKFTTSLKSGNAWHYKFKYDDRWYQNYRSTNIDYDVKMGDYFLVNFSSRDPEHSKILYRYKLDKDKFNYIDSVWDTIPLSILHSGLKSH